MLNNPSYQDPHLTITLPSTPRSSMSSPTSDSDSPRSDISSDSYQSSPELPRIKRATPSLKLLVENYNSHTAKPVAIEHLEHPLLDAYPALLEHVDLFALTNLTQYGSMNFHHSMTKATTTPGQKRIKLPVLVGDAYCVADDGSLADSFKENPLVDGVYYFTHIKGSVDGELPSLTLIGAVSAESMASQHDALKGTLTRNTFASHYRAAPTFGGELLIIDGKLAAWNPKSGNFGATDKLMLENVTVFPVEKFIPWTTLGLFQGATTYRTTSGDTNYLSTLRHEDAETGARWFAPQAGEILAALLEKDLTKAIAIAAEHGLASNDPAHVLHIACR